MEDVKSYKFCSTEWWVEVVQTWNSHLEKGSLSDFGVSRFEVTDSDLPPVLIHWDEKGNAALLSTDTREATAFRASLKSWRSFVNGDFNAVYGIVSRKIDFKGSAIFILPYIAGFKVLAEAANSVKTENESKRQFSEL